MYSVAAERFAVTIDSLDTGTISLRSITRDLWNRRSPIAASQIVFARHKNVFFREKDGADAYVDYTAAVRGHLQLAPEGIRLAALADDYARMLDDGLIFEAPPTFASLLEHCQGIQQRANADAVVSEAISKRE